MGAENDLQILEENLLKESQQYPDFWVPKFIWRSYFWLKYKTMYVEMGRNQLLVPAKEY